MIAYVTIGTNDLAKAKAFYTDLLGIIDAKPLMDSERTCGFGRNFDQPLLVVGKPFDGKPATVGNGVMVALAAGSKENVERLHAKALELGGKDEGAPGLRGEQFYMAYARDLDGNKLAFFAMA
ncbi:VOC family protein [Parvularcula lutaonensis]|uniref:VOC family protein n=1 Tax=Parvularcula lutaonensis TaxID=491923 RepID=A0ABV7MDF0_9PROT|nr:VOC family protein [Parvularcula lutaonensis]GGY49229.1 glyoxalase [Parvularcula lutaonensis]